MHFTESFDRIIFFRHRLVLLIRIFDAFCVPDSENLIPLTPKTSNKASEEEQMNSKKKFKFNAIAKNCKNWFKIVFFFYYVSNTTYDG